MDSTDSNDQNKEVGKWTSFLLKFIIPTRPPHGLHEVLPNDMRGVILVAVALIAAVTFQAGVAPPGGVWQDSSDGHVPGRAIYSTQPLPFHFFLICNTLAFSSSIYLLLYLCFGNPFFLEVLVATFSMSGTYAAAVFSVTPYETAAFRLIALVAVLPFLIRPAIYFLSKMIGKCCKGCEDPMKTNHPCPFCHVCEKHAKGSSNDVHTLHL